MAVDWQSQDSDPSLPHLARLTLEHYFVHGTLPAFTDQDLPIPAEWQQSAGLFVTISRQGKQRGCWGTLVPSARNLATATMKAAIGAATRDWRYPPLQAWELPTASIQVAIVKSFVPIESMQQVDPVHQGLFLRSGPRGAVLLPGEALTTEWQLATAQHLAGIPTGARVELFRVEVEMLHEFR
jgi:AMMECR1 domain-containing protein